MLDPQLLNQQREYSKMAKERAELGEIVARFRDWRKVEQEIQENRQLLEENDEAIRELAKEEVNMLRQRKEDLENRLKFLILPKDPNDSKNVMIEIRAGTGGDEAALFAGELYRMYTRYAESRGWRVEILSSNPTGLGGFKEIIMMVEGKGAYSRLKFEGGVHRVQRVPVTEGSGRIHTSAVTVAVLPEADEVEIDIDPKEIRVDVFRSSGPGGPERQHHGLGGADNPHTHRYCSFLPRRKVATQESRQRDEDHAGATVGEETGRATLGDRRDAQIDGGKRRPQRTH